MALWILGWVIWLIIGVVIGLIVNALTRDRHERTSLNDALIGALGAFLGGFLASQLAIARVTDFNPWSIFAALAGSILLLFIVDLSDRRGVRASADDDASSTRAKASAEEGSDPSNRSRSIDIDYLRIHPLLLAAALVILPVADAMLMRLRIPDMRQVSPSFGAVGTYQSEEGSLDYLVYAPEGYQTGTALPMLVLLHGCTQDPAVLETASGMRSVADANNFLIVYPQQNYISSPHRCWNWYDPRNQQRDSGEPALITGIIDQVKQEYSVDGERVYVAGISSGGAMTSILASCYPDVFASAAIHSGMGYESAVSVFQAVIAPFRGNQVPPEVAGQNGYECAQAQSSVIPIFVLHGTADSVVAPINADHTLQQLAQTNDYADDGEDNDTVTADITIENGQVDGGYTYTIEDVQHNGGPLMRRYMVHGLWHMWSGGTGIYPLSDPKAPNASELIWEFVSDYRLQ